MFIGENGFVWPFAPMSEMCVRRSYKNDRSAEEKRVAYNIFSKSVRVYAISHYPHLAWMKSCRRKKILHGKRVKRSQRNENIEPEKTRKVEKRTRESFLSRKEARKLLALMAGISQQQQRQYQYTMDAFSIMYKTIYLLDMCPSRKCL